MKTLVLKSELFTEVPVKSESGEVVDNIPYYQAFKMAMVRCVNAAPYSLELSRKWTNIGNKFDEATDEISLEDADFDILKHLITDGLSKAFPTMADRLWADELMRVIDLSEKG